MHLAVRADWLRSLHGIADQFRVLYGAEALPIAQLRALDKPCREFWEKRKLILDRLGGDADTDRNPELEQQVQQDLLDLAIFGADLRIRLAAIKDIAVATVEALHLLTQAETLLGPARSFTTNAVFTSKLSGKALLPTRTGGARPSARRAPLGNITRLADRCCKPVSSKRLRDISRRRWRMSPDAFWPSFYQGVCCYRLDALTTPRWPSRHCRSRSEQRELLLQPGIGVCSAGTQ